MEKQWDLSALYSGFDSKELLNDLEKLPKLVGDLLKQIQTIDLANKHAATQMLEFIKQFDETSELTEKIYAFASLTYHVNTADLNAAKLVEQVETFLPALKLIAATQQAFFKEVDDIDAFIKSESGLKAYRFSIISAKKTSEFLLSTDEELLMAQLKNTGSNAWAKLQNQVVSTLTGNFDGKEETITVLRSMAYSADKDIRKKAFEAELEAYTKKDTVSCACLNAIKGEVITEAKKRGYTSPLHMTLQSSRMDKETLEAMMHAIEEYLPYFRQYLQKKAELLGHTNGLPFYDLFAPIGSIDMRYTYDEASSFIVKQFSSFSGKLGSFAQRAFDQNWIDAFPREGKVAGAFCSNLHAIKESRIMSNFTGSFNDMTTLAHELGHGYHGDCLNDVLPANSDYPMPLAETASIFCETIVFNAALSNATKEEAQVILENSILGSTQVIVDIYSRYLFETALFEGREKASLSVEELNEAMKVAQVKAYGKGLDPETLHPYMWMCKPHYYYADSNFYNFPYAFGLLFAKGLYALYQSEPTTFLQKYDDLLVATGCNTIHDVLKIVNIDSHQPEFFIKSLELIKQEIEQFIHM